MRLQQFLFFPIIVLTFFNSIITIIVVDGKVINAVIFPHGDSAYDPTIYNNDSTNSVESFKIAKEIHKDANEIGIWIDTIVQPDIIFISSPHSAISFDSNFVFYNTTSSNVSGTVTIGPGDNVTNTNNSYYNVSISNIQLHNTYTNELVTILTNQQYEQNVSIVNINDTIPLQWGEIIPLLFLPSTIRTRTNQTRQPSKQQQQQQQQQEKQRENCPCMKYIHDSITNQDNHPTLSTTTRKISKRLSVLNQTSLSTNNSTNYCRCQGITDDNNTTTRYTSTDYSFNTGDTTTNRKYIILSHPKRRYSMGPAMVSELLQLGTLIHNYLDNLQESVLILISGDLSHTHRIDGPYGYSNTSQLYDTSIQNWINSSSTSTNTTNNNNNDDTDICSPESSQHLLHDVNQQHYHVDILDLYCYMVCYVIVVITSSTMILPRIINKHRNNNNETHGIVKFLLIRMHRILVCWLLILQNYQYR